MTRPATGTLGLRWLLVSLVTLAVLPGLVVVLIASIDEQQAQLASARDDLESTSRLVVARQEQIVDGVQRTLTALAFSPDLQRTDLAPQCVDHLAALVGKYPDFNNFGLLDLTGHMVCQGLSSTPAVYAGDRLFYRRALSTGDFSVGEFIIGRASGRRSLPFGLPVRGVDGNYRGVVFASLDLDKVNAQFKALQLPSNIRVNVTDAAGVLLMTNREDAANRIGEPMADAPLRDAVRTNRRGAFDAVDARGEVWLHHVQAIGGMGHDGLFVTLSRRRTDAMAGPIERLQLQLLALAAATFAGAFLAWVYGNLAVARPAAELLARMQRIARGDMTELPAATARSDEFIALDSGLSTMQQQLLQRERERDQLITRLQQQQQRLVDVQRLSRIAYWDFNLTTREGSWSAHVDEVLGFPAPKGPGAFDAYIAQVNHKDIANVEAALATVLAGGAAESVYRVNRADGSIGWLHGRGECEIGDGGLPVRLFGFIQDVTEAKTAEASMALLQTAISRLNDIVMITDAQPGGGGEVRIVFVNEAFERLTGYRRDEVIGQSPRILQGPLTDHAALDRIQTAMSNWQPVRETVVNYTRSGDPIWLELDIVPIADETGWFTHWVAIERDVTERKRAESALREQETRLATAMDAARLGIFDTDTARGHITWLGHHEALWGYAAGEFDGSHEMFERRIHPDDLSRVRAELAASARELRSFQHEYRVVWPDGSIHWIADKGHHFPGSDGGAARISGVALDITERKLAQQHIEQANARIGTLIENMTSGFVTLDRQWRMTYVNARGSKLMGHPVEWLLARTYFDVYPPDTPFVDAYRRALEEHVATHVEARDPVSGHWVEAHAYPSEEGISIFFSDITRRKRNEEATNHLVQRLQALHDMDEALLNARPPEEISAIGARRLRALTQAWSVVVSMIDSAAGTIKLMHSDAPPEANPPTHAHAISQWYGAVERERLHRGEACHVHDIGDPNQAGELTEGMQHAATVYGVRAYLRLPLRVEGVLVGALSVAKELAGPFDDRQIEVSRAIADRIAVAFQQAALRERIDLHARQLEQRVAERTTEVEAANRELEAFSYSVSHDLRAPLQAIDGFSLALLQRHAANLDDAGRHYLERIRAGTVQMATLIEDLISLARVSRADLRLDPVDLAVLARDAIERLRASAPARAVTVDIPAHLPARGDSRWLDVLLVNLLGNAWKFTAQTAAPHIEVGVRRLANGMAEYFVADNGAGFDMRYADKLFGAFQRLHSSHEFPGTGIGLATVQRIVLRHGGTVRAESKPGVRTVVSFTLGAHGSAA